MSQTLIGPKRHIPSDRQKERANLQSAVRTLVERVQALETDHTRTRLILRRLLSSTPRLTCADQEAWSLAEDLLEATPTPLPAVPAPQPSVAPDQHARIDRPIRSPPAPPEDP